jgi:hypothetical protein
MYGKYLGGLLEEENLCSAYYGMEFQGKVFKLHM